MNYQGAHFRIHQEAHFRSWGGCGSGCRRGCYNMSHQGAHFRIHQGAHFRIWEGMREGMREGML